MPRDHSAAFDNTCRDCPRLAAFLDQVHAEHPDYYAKPVPLFGDRKAELLVVGLAPGMHGANRTGRPFTGDYAGVLLFETLHACGFASHKGSAVPNDGLQLINCRISNAVKCLPPQNKPDTAEIRQCNGYLKAELQLQPPKIILALGSIAHQSVLMALGLKPRAAKFGHHAVHEVAGEGGQIFRLYDSYHCSRYNTQTRRLTPDMFRAVLEDIRRDLDKG